jgi:hypothetical protein
LCIATSRENRRAASYDCLPLDDASNRRSRVDAAEYAAKMERARGQAALLPDIDELLARHGADAYRREALCRVVDWTALDGAAAPPLYERYGEERVAAGRYTQVIRRREHVLPLRDALRAEVEKRSCAF